MIMPGPRLTSKGGHKEPSQSCAVQCSTRWTASSLEADGMIQSPPKGTCCYGGKDLDDSVAFNTSPHSPKMRCIAIQQEEATGEILAHPTYTRSAQPR